MSVILIPMGTPYIKKEDAPKTFKNHLAVQIIIGFVYTFVNLFFIFFLSGKIIHTYSAIFSFTQQNVFIGTLLLIVGVLAYWVSIFKSFSKEYKDEFFQKVSKCDAKEMINLGRLIDGKRIWMGVGIYIVFLLIGLILYILPIFWGTNL